MEPVARNKQYCIHPEVLVLTHEDASVTEQLPYMAARCAPVQVMEFHGRAAKRQPACKPEESVFYWWKDTPIWGPGPAQGLCLFQLRGLEGI